MSDYQGDFKNKLQWQNSDSTAHYKYNGHEYSCVIPDEIELKPEVESSNEFLNKKQEEIKNQQSEDEKQTAENKSLWFSKEKLMLIDKEIDKLIVIESLVTKKLSTGDLPPNPQKVGMFVKIICDMLENQK